MRKVQVAAVFWTLLLAVPFTALALSGSAYITDHFSSITGALARFDQITSTGGRGWILELSERLPEVIGMIVGQVVFLTILIFARQTGKSRGTNEEK